MTEQPQDTGKVVLESVADAELLFQDAESWPFESVCAVFCNELLEYVQRCCTERGAITPDVALTGTCATEPP